MDHIYLLHVPQLFTCIALYREKKKNYNNNNFQHVTPKYDYLSHMVIICSPRYYYNFLQDHKLNVSLYTAILICFLKNYKKKQLTLDYNNKIIRIIIIIIIRICLNICNRENSI